MLLFALAVIPGIFLLYYIKRKDHTHPEPWKYIWVTFLISALLVIPVGLTEAGIEKLTGWTETGPLISVFLHAFIGVALVEEFSKWVTIRIYSYRKPEFDETIDGIVYGAAAGAGFAVLENIFYVLEHGMAVAILRAVLSVPMHIFTGTLIGYGLIRQKHDKMYAMSVTLFVFSVLMHGAYDYVIFVYSKDSPGISMGVTAGIVLALLIITRFFWRRYQTKPIDKDYRPSSFKKFVFRLLAIIIFLYDFVMALGALGNYKDGKKDDIWLYIMLILVPLLIGILLWRHARRYSLQ